MAVRRERLVAAGLEVFGTIGFGRATIRAVCREAGLSPRYFYESFADKEQLLIAVYDAVVEQVVGAVAGAVAAAPAEPVARARAGVDTFVRALAGDRRWARVQLFEVVGVSPALERRRREVMHLFAGFVAEQSLALAPPGAPILVDPRLTSMGVVGAVNELLIDWMLGHVDVSLEHLVDNATALVLAAARAGLEDVEAWAATLGS